MSVEVKSEGKEDVKEFRPTVQQQKFLEVWADWPPGKPITNIGLGLETGVNARTLYEWFRNPLFMGWFDEQREHMVKADLAKVWQAMRTAACRQDTGAAKLYAERFDPYYKPTTRREHDLKADITANVRDMTDEELGRLAEIVDLQAKAGEGG